MLRSQEGQNDVQGLDFLFFKYLCMGTEHGGAESDCGCAQYRSRFFFDYGFMTALLERHVIAPHCWVLLYRGGWEGVMNFFFTLHRVSSGFTEARAQSMYK